jgi:hypothetical protein
MDGNRTVRPNFSRDVGGKYERDDRFPSWHRHLLQLARAIGRESLGCCASHLDRSLLVDPCWHADVEYEGLGRGDRSFDIIGERIVGIDGDRNLGSDSR